VPGVIVPGGAACTRSLAGLPGAPPPCPGWGALPACRQLRHRAVAWSGPALRRRGLRHVEPAGIVPKRSR